MARCTSQSVLIKRTIDLRVFCQCARNHRNRVVATVAMPGELNALRADQNVDAGAVERRAEGIRVQRLPPLLVGLFVAVRAIFRGRERAGLNELAVFGGSVSRKRDIIFAKKEIVRLTDSFGIGLIICATFGLRARRDPDASR